METETQFNQDEFIFAYPDGIEDSYWNQARNRIISSTLKKYSVGTILDVGSGRGIVTDFLFKNGIPIQGVELGSTTPISKSNVPILYNTDALSLSSEIGVRYNTISLFDVIEHIEDPVKFMSDLVSHFNNVEYLIITVPARKELWTNFDKYYGHFKRYDLVSIENEMQKIGFEVLEKKYFFNSLYVLMRLSNKIYKQRTIRFNAPKGFVKVIHTILGQLFYLEKFIAPKKLYGSSIICIAKKIKK